MRLKRRGFMLGAAAGAAFAPSLSRASAPLTLRASTADVQLLPPGYGTTTIWGYDGGVPGPEIRLRQGERVQRILVNELPQPTSTHWHGIRIENAMDGVAGLTQPAVVPGEEFDYDFVAPDAGTYWYHAHNRSVEQVARGLYGALIVEEPNPPDIDREEVLILDDWLVSPETEQLDPDFSALHDRSHAGQIGNLMTTNGRFELSIKAKHNERLRLRVVNAANARIFQLGLENLEGWIVALDGMPLATPDRFTDLLLLGPGQRADLIVDVSAAEGDTGHLFHVEGQEGYSQVSFSVSGASSRARRSAPSPLPPNRMPQTDFAQVRDVELLMQGGAMGGLQSAMMNGGSLSMRELVDAGQFWAFNGEVGQMGDAPMADLSLGETVHLRIINDTAFPHAMHLHGMHFQEQSSDGSLGPMRDTVLLRRGESKVMVIVADNPGDWLLHCHMLSHAASGMTTWLRVS